MKVKSESGVAQSCPTLSNPMDFSLPCSSVHGIFQARVLEWGAIAFSKTYWDNSSKAGLYLWLIHDIVWQKPAQYCKAIILQLNINFFKKGWLLLRFLCCCFFFNVSYLICIALQCNQVLVTLGTPHSVLAHSPWPFGLDGNMWQRKKGSWNSVSTSVDLIPYQTLNSNFHLILTILEHKLQKGTNFFCSLIYLKHLRQFLVQGWPSTNI